MPPRKVVSRFTFGIILVLFASCSPNPPRDLTGLPDTRHGLDSSQVQSVFHAAEHYPNGTQLSICIIAPDSERYVGVLRRNDSLFYVENRDSVFEIGSITKTFTGTILAKLVYEGAINPNDPIQKFFPMPLKQSSLNGHEITFVHLANHTSGLPFEPPDVRTSQGKAFSEYDPYRSYGIPRLYNYLSHALALQSTPGEKRVYSNLGFGLLGHLLTLATKKTYEELLFESICRPLGMQRTFVSLSDGRCQMIVHGRDAAGQTLPLSDDTLGTFTGAGGIRSSARDLVKFLRTNMTDTTYFLLSQRSTKEYAPHLTTGLGWGTYHEGDLGHIGAFGATGGYTSGVIFERNKRVGVVVLTNASAFLALKSENQTDKLCRALYDPLPTQNQTSDVRRSLAGPELRLLSKRSSSLEKHHTET